MLLFTRLLTLTGSPRKSMPWAMQITEYVNAHSPLPVTCWAGTFGYPLGTVAWSAMVESQTALAAATAELIGDPGYLDLVESAAELVTTPGQDLLREVVYGTPGDPPAVGSIVTVTSATAIVDRMADAVGWAVEMAQYVENVIGTPVGLFADVYGSIGGVAWIGAQPDYAAVDSASGKLNADSGYLAKVADSKGLFVEGSGRVSQARRIA